MWKIETQVDVVVLCLRSQRNSCTLHSQCASLHVHVQQRNVCALRRLRYRCRYDAARALARIAVIQGDAAAEARWRDRMVSTAAALKAHLWRPDLGACFDRERDGNQSFVSSLLHNNLRTMWHGAFSQVCSPVIVARRLSFARAICGAVSASLCVPVLLSVDQYDLMLVM